VRPLAHSRRSCHALSSVEQREDAFSPEAALALGGPGWLRQRRSEAAERYRAAGLPSGEEEIWRYSRIGDLDVGRFAPVRALPAPPVMPPLPSVAHALIDRIGERSGLVLTLDGQLVEADLAHEGERSGVWLGAASAAARGEELVGAARSRSGEDDADGVDDLAEAFGADPVLLTVPRGVDLVRPLVIVNMLAPGHSGTSTGPAVFPRTVVHLAEGAGASVIELFVSGEGALLAVPVTELSIGDGARLSYSAVQQLGRSTWQLAHGFAAAGRDATLRWFTASLGGEYARVRTDSVLDGQGGSAELLAAYLGDGAQIHDFRTLQEHAAPRTTSDLVFKGAVADVARSVYSGMIRMRRGARGSHAFQTNRNLVLSEGAHADSVPNLDIQENDVRCSHASAVGPIDAEHRFYLESRGIPGPAAERLILLGFFGELLERAEPAVRDHVAAQVRGRVQRVTEEPGR
jgi:Fe-S cluster assembly protein SufD